MPATARATRSTRAAAKRRASAAPDPGSGGESSGPATDRFNTPVIDPTSNVLALVEAAVGRLDDLRESDAVFARENLALRAEVLRVQIDGIKEIVQLRSTYDEKLRLQESQRIDAIRTVDVEAVARAQVVAQTAAGTLAAQVATSAETLRGQVAAAATAAAGALATALEPITVSINDLRRAQYEQVGSKATVVEGRTDRQGVYALAVSIVAILVTIILAAIVLIKG